MSTAQTPVEGPRGEVYRVDRPRVHFSYCYHCVREFTPELLTGFTVLNQRCDFCGEVTDLAMVRVIRTRPKGQGSLFSTGAQMKLGEDTWRSHVVVTEVR